jgi:hypothetical protein
VCGQLDHLAAQCARRAQPQEAAAAATEEEARGVEAVDPEEFRAFQEWRAAVQEAEGAEKWEQGGCALGAIALPTQAAALGVQVQKAKEGMDAQRGRGRMREGGPLESPLVTRPRTKCPPGLCWDEEGQGAAGPGLAGWEGRCCRSLEGCLTCRATATLAGPANSEPSDGTSVETCGHTGQGPQGSQRRADGAPPCQDSRARSGQETGAGFGDGAVEIDVGLLLTLASKAWLQLRDVVAMTGCQLTSELLPTGILPAAGPASGVVVSQSNPTTTMCAKALSAEGVPEQLPMDRLEGVPWEKVQEVEM